MLTYVGVHIADEIERHRELIARVLAGEPVDFSCPLYPGGPTVEARPTSEQSAEVRAAFVQVLAREIEKLELVQSAEPKPE